MVRWPLESWVTKELSNITQKQQPWGLHGCFEEMGRDLKQLGSKQQVNDPNLLEVLFQAVWNVQVLKFEMEWGYSVLLLHRTRVKRIIAAAEVGSDATCVTTFTPSLRCFFDLKCLGCGWKEFIPVLFTSFKYYKVAYLFFFEPDEPYTVGRQGHANATAYLEE